MYEHKEGITLRKLSGCDLRKLLDLKSESWWGTHKSLIINMEDQNRWFENIPKDQLYMVAEWNTAESTPDKPILTNDPETRSKFKLKAGPGKVWALREVVGVAVYTDIDHISRTCKISGSVLREHRKPEIVRAGFSAGVDFAFEILNMHRIEAEVLAYHVASQNLQTDLGFRVEGRRTEAVYKCGRYYDSLMMGMLREEWQGTPRVRAHGDSCNNNFSHDRMSALEERANRDGR